MKAFLFSLDTAIIVLLGTMIAVFLFKRKLFLRFPIFSCYIAYSTLDTVVRVVMLWQKGEMAYFQVYWYSEIGELLLALLSMSESLFAMFAGFGRYRWFRLLVSLSALLALAYGFWKAWIQPPQAGHWIMSLVVSAELIFQYWLMGTGVLFFGLVFAMGIPLQQRECWIIFGFLAESFLIVCGFLSLSLFGQRSLLLSTVLSASAYLVGKTVWLIGVTLPEDALYTPPRAAVVAPSEMISILDRQIAAIRTLFDKGFRMIRKE